jgi:hypothetical protein
MILCGAEIFRQRPNFLVDLAEKFGQQLETLFEMSLIRARTVNRRQTQYCIAFSYFPAPDSKQIHHRLGHVKQKIFKLLNWRSDFF